MNNKLSWPIAAIYLLQIAGFFIMLFFGFITPAVFLLGLAIYLAGLGIIFFLSQFEDLENIGVLTVFFYLVNLVFFVSLEIFPLLDLSLVIYGALTSNLAVLAYRKCRLARQKPKLPHLLWVGVFLAAVMISGPFAEHFKNVFYFFGINLAAVVFAYAVINLFWNSRVIKTMIQMIVGLSFVSAVFAVWQLYAESFKWLYYPYLALRDQEILELWEVVSRVVGTWQHPSYLGIYLSLSIPLGVYLLFYKAREWKDQMVWTIVLVLNCAVLLLTNTRSSVLSGFLGVILFYILLNSTNWRFLKRIPSIKKIALLGIIVIAALAVYQFVFVAEIYTKPQAFRVDASATIWGRFLRSDPMSTESLVQRSMLYKLAWDEYLLHPITGIGAKNFIFKVEEKYQKGTDSHNLILQTAAETGTVGLLATLLLYGSVLIALFQKVKNSDFSSKPLQAALFATMLLILFDSMFNNPLYSLRILAVFWLLLALQYVNFSPRKAYA